MPFDATVTATDQPLLTSTGRAALADLRDLLRDRSRWPAGFTWFYPSPCTCAVGLARRAWSGVPLTPGLDLAQRTWDATVAIFDLDLDVRCSLFIDAGKRFGIPMSLVTPEHVAAAIDEHLRASAP